MVTALLPLLDAVTWYWMIKANFSGSLPPDKGGSGRENWSMKLALVNIELRASRQETVTAGLAHAAQAVALGLVVMVPATSSPRD